MPAPHVLGSQLRAPHRRRAHKCQLLPLIIPILLSILPVLTQAQFFKGARVPLRPEAHSAGCPWLTGPLHPQQLHLPGPIPTHHAQAEELQWLHHRPQSSPVPIFATSLRDHQGSAASQIPILTAVLLPGAEGPSSMPCAPECSPTPCPQPTVTSAPGTRSLPQVSRELSA